MSIEPRYLTAPTGELEPSLFPGGDLAARLDAYITEGYAQAASLGDVAQDAYVKAWAYYRGYDAALLLRAIDPSKVSLDSGKTALQFTPEQTAEIGKRRDRWKATADGILADAGETSEPPRRTSGAVVNEIVW